jgi:hypothetical protein
MRDKSQDAEGMESWGGRWRDTCDWALLLLKRLSSRTSAAYKPQHYTRCDEVQGYSSDRVETAAPAGMRASVQGATDLTIPLGVDVEHCSSYMYNALMYNVSICT